MSSQSKYKYMHTLDGEPAAYFDNEQICFCSTGKRSAVILCDDMNQIRRERRLSDKWRKAQGWYPSVGVRGYVMVKMS